jgi:alpha-maltose-1-phosphate synthase
VDFVLSPRSFVTRSFLERGFVREQMIPNVYPLDLVCFTRPVEPRPAARPLTVISTGSLSLRKGTPYLLEAFRLILKQEPTARLRLTSVIADSVEPILARYRDLPIDWAPGLPHPQLAERLRGSDVFVLPSLEDGFARTVAEALACGLPVITTPNTGASDLVKPDSNGEAVPIRDAPAIADAVLKWWERVRLGHGAPIDFDPGQLSFEHFSATFLSALRSRSLIP